MCKLNIRRHSPQVIPQKTPTSQFLQNITSFSPQELPDEVKEDFESFPPRKRPAIFGERIYQFQKKMEKNPPASGKETVDKSPRLNLVTTLPPARKPLKISDFPNG